MSKKSATADAKAALANIRARSPRIAAGLKIDVWENLGWNWCLRGSDFQLYDHGKRGFAILASPGGAGGRFAWMVDIHSESAAKLLHLTLDNARAEVAKLQGAIDRMAALVATKARASEHR